MTSVNPRVQVTVDPELGEALSSIDPHPASKSRLIRDLALRGAAAEEQERARHEEAIESLLKVADGEIPYDFEALGQIVRERHEAIGSEPPDGV
jgi:hypothetical protein